MSGQVTPDRVIVDKKTGLVKEVNVEDKVVMTTLTGEGTAEVPVNPDQRRQMVLTSDEAIELTRLGCAIEDYFGAPQDIEWAVSGDVISILQSRPVPGSVSVRSLPPADEPAKIGDDQWPAWDEKPEQPFDLWTMANLGEIWPDPVSPLMWSGVPTIISGGNRNLLRGLNSTWLDSIQWVKRFYGRLYYNEGALAYLLS